MFERITEAEINERSMANVSTTPGRRTAFGEGNMDAKALKLRFDRLGRYLAKRLNEVFDGIADGSLAEVLYIDSQGEKRSLKDFVDSLLTGQVESIKIQTSDGVITLTELGDRTQEMYNGLDTGDLAGKIKIIEGVTLKKFYEDFLKFEDNIAPVKSVNGKTGEVTLNAEDVGARPDTWMPTAQEVGADPSGSASTAVSGHNVQTDAHNDIRIELQRLAGIIADLLDSDDATLDEMHEIVAYIKSNKALIDAITTSKVNVADIIDNLTTNVSDRPLSAAQGVALKALIADVDISNYQRAFRLQPEPTDVVEVIATHIQEKGGNVEDWNVVILTGYFGYTLGIKMTYTGGNYIVYVLNLNTGVATTQSINISTTTISTLVNFVNLNTALKTTDKSSIVNAINEVNGKTVDKISSFEMEKTGDIPLISPKGTIIHSVNQKILDDYDGVITEAWMQSIIPIVAGENVTFEVDEENQVVKINSTGGGSSTDNSMIGTWVFNDEVEIPESLWDKTFYFLFSLNNNGITETYNEIYFWDDGSGFSYYGDRYSKEESYSVGVGWTEDYCKTTTILEEPPAEAATWTRANAKKQGGGMPKIRFANFTEYKNEEGMTMYRFTVENLGGGTLQVGDKLQICCRRKYPGGKKKLRKMAFYEITEEDINQRFLKIEVDPNDESNDKWLFRNDRKGGNTLSAMYFRLKRVTKYSGIDGKECDAIFSNVETVWKTFYMVEDKYSLKIK